MLVFPIFAELNSVCVFRYGLGMIYYKQEKFNLAEIHFKKALSINPQSSVLLCHIGVVCVQFVVSQGPAVRRVSVVTSSPVSVV